MLADENVAGADQGGLTEADEPRHSRELLIVGQKAVALARANNPLMSQLPRAEVSGLSGQLRRAAMSVSSNIAEGQVRRTTGEFSQVVSQAEGSLAAIDTQLIRAVELGFASQVEVEPPLKLVDERQRMLKAPRSTLESRRTRSRV